MLLSLVFRGVAFEFRFRDAEHRTFWDNGFCYGSALGAFAQGVVLGAFIQGFEVDGRHFVGRSLDCFTPFSLLTGVALMFGYALLGAGWLVLKTEGPLQEMARRSDATPSSACSWPPSPCQRVDALSPVHRRALVFLAEHRLPRAGPYLTALVRLRGGGRSTIGRKRRPSSGGRALRLSYLGLAISLFPMIVPFKYTIWQAASSEATQAFLLVGVLVLLPVILLYTAWSYWVFRGKVRADIGYH